MLQESLRERLTVLYPFQFLPATHTVSHFEMIIDDTLPYSSYSIAMIIHVDHIVLRMTPDDFGQCTIPLPRIRADKIEYTL